MIRAVIISVVMSLATHVLANNIVEGDAGNKLQGKIVSQFDNPWAMSFIDNVNLLVTTKPGKLWLINTNGEKSLVSGVPKVFAGGQGGLGDVIPHPNFVQNKLFYISYINSDDGGRTRYASVLRGNLKDFKKPHLENVETIWNQSPARSGRGHFSHRIAFGPDGTKHSGKIFITSGDRQEQKPAQEWNTALGKIIRINEMVRYQPTIHFRKKVI